MAMRRKVMTPQMMEHIWQSLKKNLKTYCDENGFSDVILGLSGGLDSALVSVLATQALGAEHVHAVMMKTKHTSELSLQIAATIAALNGFDYKVIDIEPVIENQIRFLAASFGEEPKNIVLENLQARERGKTLMAFSNQFGYLVLACGNKSEAAMGYCTLYGDTCGGISPIGNLYKSQIFEIAKWLNTEKEVLPQAVIERAPSAELSDNQKDEDTLPPYHVLDGILSAYLEQGKKENEIVKYGFPEKTVRWVLNRYRKMAFKREQTPKSLKIDL